MIRVCVRPVFLHFPFCSICSRAPSFGWPLIKFQIPLGQSIIHSIAHVHFSVLVKIIHIVVEPVVVAAMADAH